MADRRRYLYPLAAGALIAALGWWLVADQDGPPGEPIGTQADQSPRYFATNATFRTYGPSGPLSSRIQAQRFEYYKAADKWQLTQPRWQRFGETEDSRRWRGRAQKGWLTEDETRARLRGDVRLITPGEHGPIRLFTQRLWLHLPRDYAETDRRVRIEASHWQHSGTGAQFWMAEERLNLLANAEGKYAQP